MSSGVKVEADYLKSLLQDEVIKRDLIEGDEAKAALQNIRRFSEQLRGKKLSASARTTLRLLLRLRTHLLLSLGQLQTLLSGWNPRKQHRSAISRYRDPSSEAETISLSIQRIALPSTCLV